MTPPSTTSVSVVTSWQLVPRVPSNVLTWHLVTSPQQTENRSCKTMQEIFRPVHSCRVIDIKFRVMAACSVGGNVQSLAWDPTGERLAVLFTRMYIKININFGESVF